ncbi:MAG: hypothetical protein HC878_00005 [Leptolyngbyaceae cyanobacterium SL_5_14]|nr:hypothetical protein [Leptolyngbyaceae cyanobacterium SL_5_14]
MFAELGFATDPMKVLYDAILFVNQEILGLTKIVAQIKNFVSNGDGSIDLREFIGSNLGDAVSEYSTRFADLIVDVAPIVFENLYDLLALGADALLLTTTNINWGALFMAIADSLGKAIMYAVQPDNIGSTMKIALIALAPFLVAKIVGAIVIGVGTLVGGMTLAFAASAAAALGTITLGLAGIALALTIAVVKAYAENWDSVTLAISFTLKQIGTAIVDALKPIYQVVADKFSQIKNKAVEIFDSIIAFWDSLSEAVTRAIARVPSFGSTPTGAGASAGALIGARVFGSRAEGQIPNASGGFINNLMSAVSREAGAMPSGARVVIANSSEAILNRAQQSALGGMMRGSTIPANLSIGNINLANSPGMTPEQQANQVLMILAQKYAQFRESQMSAVIS